MIYIYTLATVEQLVSVQDTILIYTCLTEKCLRRYEMYNYHIIRAQLQYSSIHKFNNETEIRSLIQFNVRYFGKSYLDDYSSD